MLKHLAPGGPAVLAVFMLLILFSRFLEKQVAAQVQRESVRDTFMNAIVNKFTTEMKEMMAVVHEDRRVDRDNMKSMYDAAMTALSQINRTVERRQKPAPPGEAHDA